MAMPSTTDPSAEGDYSYAFNKKGINGKGKRGGNRGKKKSKKKTTGGGGGGANDRSTSMMMTSKPDDVGDDDDDDGKNAPRPQSTTYSSDGDDCGPKRVHDDDDEDDDDDDGDDGHGLPSSQQKQRSTSTSPSPSSSSNLRSLAIHLAFYVLGMSGIIFTVPLIFSSCAHVGCGGRTNVNRMVDSALSKQQRHARRRSLGGGDDPSSASYSSSFSLVGRGGGDGRDERVSGGSSAIVDDGELSRYSSIVNIRESMCHVASIAIGQFSLYLPYAQWLVMRDPLAHPPASTEIDGPTPTCVDDDGIDEKAKASKKLGGAIQWIIARRRKKNDERRERGERMASSSSSSSASDEIDRMHPIRHILEGASIFSHHRKQKLMEKRAERKERGPPRPTTGDNDDDDTRVVVDWKKWKFAMSDDYELKTEEIDLVKELARRVIAKAEDIARCPQEDDANDANDDCIESERRITSLSGGSDMPHRPFHERCDGVSWGGILDDDTTRWWPRKSITDPPTMISYHSEGGRILAAYLKIMRWPSDLSPKFPFRLCAKGCDSEVSLLHTLEFREKYRPWCVSGETIRFNGAGFIYSRGHSNPGIDQRRRAVENERSGSEGHSMVWYRPGLASPSANVELYTRSIINVLDVAVSDSLVRNGGTVGRFNIVMDCAGMSSRNSPSVAGAKRLFSILQDHYPDRLGVLLAANLSGMTQMLMKMMLPFVTEDVRAKIHIVPNGEVERREMLVQFIAEDKIPYYLGGKDDYEYDATEYYRGKCVLPEDGIEEYITTMPFHA